MCQHGEVLIFQHNGDGCIAIYQRCLLSLSFLAGAAGVSLTSLQLLTSKRKSCTKRVNSKLATELTIFMHYVGILVGVAMPTHDVLLQYF